VAHQHADFDRAVARGDRAYAHGAGAAHVPHAPSVTLTSLVAE
jgi:hypothetical protein